ncbi:hypothetical protein [Gaoshiqia sediminis]|uniref:Uncharacterized protein n=1 Tax=Gaoshiqia sediminis TaxID=2986998 RepID=A0AA41Y797_9BACT|nr:hypothetical protein [Gaoshiqia sediminis]MCW0484724.1 hypothetical protein [Gaoshiqia sediminis]
MDDNNNLKKIQEAIDSLPDNFSILEEQIDVDLQMEYFDYVKDKRSNEGIEDFDEAERQLNDPALSEDEKKQLLVRLAGHDQVEAFRIIERFHKGQQGVLRNWAVLALQESRMILQSSLLGEQQVFISTGLGGKGQNIRYFIAMMKREIDEPFTETQQKVIENEFQFFLAKGEGEVEEISFVDGLALGLFLFPLKKNLQDIFRSFIDECNQYGNFLREDVIITNVKKLTVEDIKNFLNNQDDLNNHDDEPEQD